MDIRDDGRANPLVILSPDDVALWLRTKADEAGYADRALSAVQVSVSGVAFAECPKLVLMVSNIKNSRG